MRSATQVAPAACDKELVPLTTFFKTMASCAGVPVTIASARDGAESSGTLNAAMPEEG